MKKEEKKLEEYLEEFPVSTNPSAHVLLLGSCNPSTWRFTKAIPELEKAGVTYFNPQLPDGIWNDEHAELEDKAKRMCEKILVVLEGSTRSFYVNQELIELAFIRRNDTYAVILPIEEGTIIDGNHVIGREYRDISNARKKLISKMEELGVRLFNNIEDAVQAVIDDLKR